MEYKNKFFKKIKELLSYFIEFNENKLILSKKYPKDCIIKELNEWPIIIIIYDKSFF